MPSVEDIYTALDDGDAKKAEALIKEVGAKNQGAGISGHDLQIFEARLKNMKGAAKAEATEQQVEDAAQEAEAKKKAAEQRARATKRTATKKAAESKTAGEIAAAEAKAVADREAMRAEPSMPRPTEPTARPDPVQTSEPNRPTETQPSPREPFGNPFGNSGNF